MAKKAAVTERDVEPDRMLLMPDDILIVTYPRELEPEEATRISRTMQQVFQPRRCVVLDEGAKVSVPGYGPHLCPVCQGKGIVPAGFYDSVGEEIMKGSIAIEPCRTCAGRGIVWRRIGS